MFYFMYGLLCFCAMERARLTRGQEDDGKRYICRAVAISGDAGCPVTLLPDLSAGGQEEELRNTVMQLRETISQQKETISKQLGTINELTTKLSLCASAPNDRKYGKGGSWGKDKQNTMGDVPRDPNDSIDNLGKTMQGLKDRLENLEQQQMRANVSGASFPSELRDLLQRRLGELEKQLLKKVSSLEEEKSVLSNATAAYRLKTESALNALVERISELEKGGDFKSPEQFKLCLPQRTNYLYGRITKSLPEMYAFTICMWIRSSSSPGIGTPFSYGVPGQANEIVLIEWGNNPIELLINDKVAQLPLEVRDGKWHHVCVCWTTRDGQWEAYQDGERLGAGDNLAAWHPIKPGGVIILGQEHDVVGGRFDAGQAFVGELSQVNIWDRILKPTEIQSMANCSSYIPGNVISWLASNVEVFGRGASKRPLEICRERVPNA